MSSLNISCPICHNLCHPNNDFKDYGFIDYDCYCSNDFYPSFRYTSHINNIKDDYFKISMNDFILVYYNNMLTISKICNDFIMSTKYEEIILEENLSCKLSPNQAYTFLQKFITKYNKLQALI